VRNFTTRTSVSVLNFPVFRKVCLHFSSKYYEILLNLSRNSKTEIKINCDFASRQPPCRVWHQNIVQETTAISYRDLLGHRCGNHWNGRLRESKSQASHMRYRRMRILTYQVSREVMPVVCSDVFSPVATLCL